MTQFPVSTSSEQSIYAALELSKNSWLLAIQVPGRDNPSLYPISGGNAEGLMAKLDAASAKTPFTLPSRETITAPLIT
jgi:transposase